MDSIQLALISFLTIFGSAALGFVVQKILPERYRSAIPTEPMLIGAGLVASMAGLVLALLITSTRGTLDQVEEKVNATASDFIRIDRMLADYGPETAEVRKLVREALLYRIEYIWPRENYRSSPSEIKARSHAEDLCKNIIDLNPSTERQRFFQQAALTLASDLLRLRWEIEATDRMRLPMMLYIIPILWISFLTFLSALYSPRNVIVFVVLFFCCLSISSAFYMISEMSCPLEGMIKVSREPLQMVLDKIGD